MKISVAVPTRNEEATLEPVLNEIVAGDYEVFVIDGHSTDNTCKIARKFSVPVYFDSGRGKGEAMRMALDIFTGDILVYIDADGSHDPSDIPALVKPIVADQADMVIGVQVSGGIR